MSATDFGDEREEIIADFIVETDELIERLDQELVQLEDSPTDSALLNSIFRAAHTIKGTSSFLGFDRMTELTHKAENVLDKLRNAEFEVNADIMDALLDALDGIRALLDEIRAGQADSGDYDPTPIATRLTSIVKHGGQLGDDDSGDEPSAPEPEVVAEEPQKVVRNQTKRIVRSLVDQAKAAVERGQTGVRTKADIEARAAQAEADASSASKSSSLDDLLASAPAVKPKLHVPGDEPRAKVPKAESAPSSLDDLLASAPKVSPKISIPGEERKKPAPKTDLDALLATAPRVSPKISIPGEAHDDESRALVDRDKPLPAGIDIDRLLAAAPPVQPKLVIPGEGGGRPLRPNASLDDLLASAPKVSPKISIPGEEPKQPEAPAKADASDDKTNTNVRHRGRPPSATDRVSTRTFSRSQASTASAGPANPAKSAPARRAPRQTEAPIKSVAVEHTIRVDVERLDALMNLAGELVLGRNRLSNITRQLEGTSAEGETVQELANIVANISLITGNIQMAVMKTRMLPIGKVFNRFPRMVRDLAREKKKLVDLQIIGGDTEVDKSVIEAIGDPLVHLIRNSVDHGIESPAARAERGKAETGRVRLSAEHEGNNVLIKIQDDGAGMDPDRIGKVALSRGVVDEAALSRMTDKRFAS